MATSKDNGKTKVTTRKAVSQAIATQDKENKVEVSKYSPQVEEAIRVKAYELYMERGGYHGHDQDDWAAAEAIILKKKR